MSLIRIGLAALLAAGILTGSSCQTMADPRAGTACAPRDERPWAITKTPQDAEAYRKAWYRTDKPVSISSYERETWFALATGEVMVCKTYGPIKNSCGISWAQFRKGAAGIEMTNEVETVCVS